MKITKYFSGLLVLLVLAIGCTKENYDDLSFIESAAPPANLSAYINITQDNTGLVTITPNGDGVNFFAVYFGDGTTDPDTVQVGKSTEHVYAEGNYNVKIVGHGVSGKKSENEVPLTVSFRKPENFEIMAENDQAISKKVNISATADYATSIEVYFGESNPDVAVLASLDEVVSHIYTNPGDYDITVIAKSGGVETYDSTFTFTVTEIIGPATPAPTPPTKLESDVISVFSDAYTNLPNTNFNPNWGQSTVINTIDIGGNSTLKYSNLNYQGTEFENPIDASAMDYLHVDVWTDDATSANFFCISTGPAEKAYSFVITSGAWVSYDIPLTHFSDVVDLADIIQFKVDGTAGSSVYFDNIYFYRETPTAPTTSAPTPPALAPDKVISIFSEAYTAIAGTDFNPNWGQSTVVTTEEVATGDNILKYANLNYQGTDLGSTIDVSSLGYLHIDMWTYDATAVNVFPISNAGEKAYALPITPGEWVSYDIPLTKFSDVVDLTDIYQLKFDGTVGATIYLDNIYFH